MRARTLSLFLLMRSLQGVQPCPSHVSPSTLLARPGVLATPASTTATWTAYGALCSCVTITENSAVPKKNMSQNEKVLISEPLSKPSTGPSIQSLCMKIDSHSCAFFLALTRIIHRPHEEGEYLCPRTG